MHKLSGLISYYNNYKNSHENIPSSDKSTFQDCHDLNTDFECILDCCDLVFDSVYEIILPNSYKERFNDLNTNLLTFEERKEVDLMRKFFR